MADFEHAHHLAVIAEAKDHLGMLPGNLRAGLARYFDLGIEPGRFLCAVIENDLVGAAHRCFGDPDTVDVTLQGLTSFFYNYAPPDAWGSREKRIAWQARVSRLSPRSEPPLVLDLDDPPVEEVPGV